MALIEKDKDTIHNKTMNSIYMEYIKKKYFKLEFKEIEEVSIDRIKIFLSSAVDDETTNKFSNLRKELKRDLELLDLFNIYIFECGYGTSKNVVDDYLDELYHSDLCLFLIDRSEGVPDGVLKEIQDAVKYDK